jgi:CubicO group peptidase (beta-lactamase class C family)
LDGVVNKIGAFADHRFQFHPEAQVRAGFADVPVLFIGGKADPRALGGNQPPIAEAAAAGLNNVDWVYDGIRQAVSDQPDSPHKVSVIDGAGHSPTNKPGVANDIVDDFITQILSTDPPYPFGAGAYGAQEESAEEAKMPVATDLHSHGVTQDQIESLAETLCQAVQKKLIAGCSFLVAHKGEIVFRKAFGYADIESKRPFTTNELLPIASVSKPFMASVIMVLVDQGKLNLDDPVEKYLPAFKGKRIEGSQSPARPMTIRHLLSHTAGFWGNKGITPEKMDLIRNFERPLAETIELVAEYDLVYQPGTKWIYSGVGYCVLGRVAEVSLGQSLEEIAQDALFRPLDLNRTTYLPSKEVRKTVPTAYLRQRGKLQKQPSMAEIDLRFFLPGGSLFTTMDELAVFGQMHLNDGVYKGKRILSEASVTEMRRLQSPDRPKRTYGFGWFRDDISESGLADLLFHSGALGARLRVDRSREVVCVFLVHQSSAQTVEQPNKLFELVDEMFPAPDGR